jgi:hypothetical protein
VTLNISRLGPDAVLYWYDANYLLQEADSVSGPWRFGSSTNSPAAAELDGTRFFRLRR